MLQKIKILEKIRNTSANIRNRDIIVKLNMKFRGEGYKWATK